MEKRYQVFISSTYQDLQGARQEVSQALLRADCFPAGMELFPAADEEQFEFIKTVIDQSDYYIIISAGRYGTIHPETGLSYTEMEYDYAVEIGKPVIRLLHKDPFRMLIGEFIEPTDQGKKKLKDLREKLSSSRLVGFWSNPQQLGLEATIGILNCIRTKPACGWIRDTSGRTTRKIETKIKRLEKAIKDIPRMSLDDRQNAFDSDKKTEDSMYEICPGCYGSGVFEEGKKCDVCRGSGTFRHGGF